MQSSDFPGFFPNEFHDWFEFVYSFKWNVRNLKIKLSKAVDTNELILEFDIEKERKECAAANFL